MILLDVAGYGLFDNADAFLATAGKVLATGASLVLGGFFLLILLVVSLAGIGFISLRRGVRYRSVPRTVGTFFRWGGVAVATFLSLLVIPIVAIWFQVSAVYLFIAFIVTLGIGYLVGRAVSKLIGIRLQKYAGQLRTADTIGSKIIRFVNGMQ